MKLVVLLFLTGLSSAMASGCSPCWNYDTDLDLEGPDKECYYPGWDSWPSPMYRNFTCQWDNSKTCHVKCRDTEDAPDSLDWPIHTNSYSNNGYLPCMQYCRFKYPNIEHVMFHNGKCKCCTSGAFDAYDFDYLQNGVAWSKGQSWKNTPNWQRDWSKWPKEYVLIFAVIDPYSGWKGRQRWGWYENTTWLSWAELCTNRVGNTCNTKIGTTDIWNGLYKYYFQSWGGDRFNRHLEHCYSGQTCFGGTRSWDIPWSSGPGGGTSAQQYNNAQERVYQEEGHELSGDGRARVTWATKPCPADLPNCRLGCNWNACTHKDGNTPNIMEDAHIQRCTCAKNDGTSEECTSGQTCDPTNGCQTPPQCVSN